MLTFANQHEIQSPAGDKLVKYIALQVLGQKLKCKILTWWWEDRKHISIYSEGGYKCLSPWWQITKLNKGQTVKAHSMDYVHCKTFLVSNIWQNICDEIINLSFVTNNSTKVDTKGLY